MKKLEGGSILVAARIPLDTHKRLKAWAKKKKANNSRALRTLLRLALDHVEKAPRKPA